MTQDDEVRAMDVAAKLVTTLMTDGRGWAATDSIVAFGVAVGELARQCGTVEEIQSVGELLAAITWRDCEKIRKGERWGKRPRLTVEEGQEVLWSMTLEQLGEFAQRWDYTIEEVIEWARRHRGIPNRALGVLGDQEEMAQIMEGER